MKLAAIIACALVIVTNKTTHVTSANFTAHTANPGMSLTSSDAPSAP